MTPGSDSAFRKYHPGVILCLSNNDTVWPWADTVKVKDLTTKWDNSLAQTYSFISRAAIL